jgi:hypothetical protein
MIMSVIRSKRVVSGVLLLCASVLAFGCVSARTVPLAKTVAARGQEVATAAMTFYDDVDAMLVRDKAQQDFVRVLRMPAGADFPDTPLQDFSAQLSSRRTAFTALKNAYGRYQALAESAAPEEVSTATGGLVDAANGLSNGPHVSAQAKSLLGAAAGRLVEAQRGRNLRRYNQALLELVNAYRTVWLDDTTTWREVFTGVEQSYTSAIAGLPVTSFDAGKIAGLVTEPVAAERRIPIYQLNLINAERAREAATEEKMRTVTRALDALVAAHAALASDKPSVTDITLASKQILTLTGGNAQ